MNYQNINLDAALEGFIKFNLREITQHDTFKEHDVLAYYGSIDMGAIEIFRLTVEMLISIDENAKKNITKIKEQNRDELQNNNLKEREKRKLAIILHTGGGSVETVEKFVEISRHFYDRVDFIIPEYAMSAGTIWCMSGDSITMNYAASLGPIDPQVKSANGKWIPALGYLDKLEELIKKSADGTLTQAEMVMMSSLDLAELQRYRQAAELSKDLLKKWLVAYKFKDWDTHQATQGKIGKIVTDEEKTERADEIAKCLNDIGIWRSHSRFIGIKTLKEKLKLKIDDYSEDAKLAEAINQIHKLILQFQQKISSPMVIICRSHYEDIAELLNE